MKEFEEIYLLDTQKAQIHSFRARVKDPEHLIVKIIRKRKEKYKKYKALTKDNYERFVTDLIGVRCFILFKEEWEGFHRFITDKFEDNPEFYIQDPLNCFDKNENHNYMAEAPKVHIRTGDNREIYEKLLPPNRIISDKIYRSIHYIIKYRGVYLEIQVRTLFEEGWGEIDHKIVYPYYQKDPVLKQYTEMINRLSGLPDEMGSFFHKLKFLEEVSLKDQKKMDPDAMDQEDDSFVKPALSQPAPRYGNTSEDCLLEVIYE